MTLHIVHIVPWKIKSWITDLRRLHELIGPQANLLHGREVVCVGFYCEDGARCRGVVGDEQNGSALESHQPLGFRGRSPWDPAGKIKRTQLEKQSAVAVEKPISVAQRPQSTQSVSRGNPQRSGLTL